MEEPVINRDLARWSRPQWFWAVLLVFVLQFAVFRAARPMNPRLVYPAEPVLKLGAEGPNGFASEWLKLEDPMLFASPSWHGVSALAWMRKPEMPVEVAGEFPAVRFLHQGDAKELENRTAEMPARIAAHRRPAPEATLPVPPPPGPEPVSRFAFEGFGDRKPLSTPPLPMQLHSDVVSRTVVQAAVDADGFVVSSRVVLPSGSKQADLDGLAFARGLRFEPMRGTAERMGEVAWGKLIFEWHALDLSRTNAVRRQ